MSTNAMRIDNPKLTPGAMSSFVIGKLTSTHLSIFDQLSLVCRPIFSQSGKQDKTPAVRKLSTAPPK
jgi:hypothetical protein